MSRSWWAAIETGRQQIELDDVDDVAQALGVDAAAVFTAAGTAPETVPMMVPIPDDIAALAAQHQKPGHAWIDALRDLLPPPTCSDHWATSSSETRAGSHRRNPDTVAGMSRPKKPRKAKPRLRHDIRWWTADDALRVQARTVDWLRTSEGTKGVYVTYTGFYQSTWPDSADPWKLSAGSAASTADMIADANLIWCDPPMVDLIAAAADVHPVIPAEPHQLIAPEGIVIFAKPLPTVFADADTGEDSLVNVSAITWGQGLSTKDEPFLSISTWQRGVPGKPVQYVNPSITVQYSDLRPAATQIGVYGVPPQEVDSPGGLRLLQTFCGLARSPLIRDEQAPGSKDARGRATRTGIVERNIRRIHLRRPDLAANELDAARAERAGQRGHWVRGHWKDQWYPSVEEHRTIFIEGYPRGDFAKGEVTGPKVLVASNRQPATDTPTQTET